MAFYELDTKDFEAPADYTVGGLVFTLTFTHNYGTRINGTEKVARLTKTKVVLMDGNEYRRSDGRDFTKGRAYRGIRPTTQAEVDHLLKVQKDRVEQGNLARELDEVCWKNFSLTELRKVKAFLAQEGIIGTL
jgi:hypothetical protein